MKNFVKPVLLLLVMLSLPASVFAQAFGKNKVSYENFDWSLIETQHFIIHFYEGGQYIAEFAADVLENELATMENDFNYSLQKRIPVMIYKSHNHFQQTNIVTEYLREGIGGVTELLKNRVFLPFEGSYDQFRHVLHHELVHAYINDMIYGGSLQNIIAGGIQLQLPLWFAEGLAEYVSLGWDTRTDMIIRDGTINDYLQTRMSPYPAGQSIFRYIEEKYGKQKVAEIVRRVNITKNLERGFRSSLGIDFEQLIENWDLAMKRKYWPDITDREFPSEFATRLTDHTELDNYLNIGAAISPNGDKIAFLTDRNEVSDIYLMSAVNGKISGKLLSGQTTPSLEELHWLSPGMSWSPGGDKIALSVKSGDQDALTIIDVKTKKFKQIKFGLDGVFDADWSPLGDEIAFQGSKDGATDIYSYNVVSGTMRKITDDYFSDKSPAWSPDGSKLLFVSDRKDFVEAIINGNGGSEQEELLMQNHDYISTDIYVMTKDGSDIERLTFDKHNEAFPVWSPDGKKFAYTSEANGISNIYIYDFETRESYPITNTLTGAFQLSWSREGSKLVFSSFSDGGWDIYMIKNPLSKESKAEKIRNTVFFDQLAAIEQETQQDRASDSAERLANEAREKVVQPDFSNYIFDDRVRNRTLSERKSRKTIEEDVDPLKYKTADGKFKVNKYKLKFSPDIVYGNYTYDTFFGVQGSSIFQFSDMLGNHSIIFATDLYFDLKNSNYQLFYFNSARRTNYGIGLHNQANFFTTFTTQAGFYEPVPIRLRDYGLDVFASRPFSRFSRAEGGVSIRQVSQEYLNSFYAPLNQTFTMYQTTLSLIHDTTLWRFYGPVDGVRANLTATYSPAIGKRESRIGFTTVTGDFRKYIRLGRSVSFATRFNGGMSEGESPERFFLGGVPNWLNRRFKGDIRTNVNDIFFSHFVMPLRGSDYYELIGTRFALLNTELRFPFIQALLMGWPLPILIQNVAGSLFLDVGAVWDKSNFQATQIDAAGNRVLHQDHLKAGYGAGVNFGLFGMYFRLDVAWGFDLQGSTKPKYYFSFLSGDW